MTTTAVSGRRDLIVKNLLIVYGAQVIMMILSVLPVTYLPIFLDALGIGQVTIAEAVNGILGTLMALGTSNYLIREIARDHDQVPELLSSAVALRALLSLLLLPVAFVLPSLWGYPDQTRDVILLIYVAIVIRTVGDPIGLALQAIGKVGWRSSSNIVWKLTMVGLGWTVLVRGGGVIAYSVVFIVANTIEVLINLAYFVFVGHLRPVIRYRSLRGLFLGGLPFFLWVFLQTIYMQTSGLLLGMLGGEVATGWYGAAMQFLLPLYSLPGVAIYVLLPQFAQIHVHSGSDFKHVVSRSLNYVFLLTLPAAVGLGLLAGPVIDLFNYPETFQNSVPVLRLLALSLPFTVVTMIIATGVSAMRRERTWAIVSLCSLIALVSLNVLLIPVTRTLLENAAIGAALALVGAELVTIGAAWRLFGHSMIDHSFFTLLGKTILAVAAMAVVVQSTVQLPIVVPIGLGALTYGAMVVWIRALPGDDLDLLLAGFNRRIRPALIAVRRALTRDR